jgi:hypothetical protein
VGDSLGLEAWDPLLKGYHLLPWPPSTLFTAEVLGWGPPFPPTNNSPFLSLLPLSLLLCAPELSSCHFNRIKASE